MPGAAQFFPGKETLKTDKAVRLEICQCSGCGLVQLANDPVFYYKQVIRAASFSGEMKDFRIKQFANFVKKFALKGKKVIEIGCGRGEYLSIMQQCGIKAYGLEYCEDAAKQCNRNGLKVLKGYIQSSAHRLKYGPFEAFFILNFLEHLPNPNSTLRGIFNNLTDEAIGLVEVPNFDMILQKKLFSEFIGDHLFYFTRETLNTTLSLNGFEIIDLHEVWHDYIISAIVRRRKQLDTSNFYKLQATVKNDIERYIHRFKNKKVAIWGAGHQALAVISLMNLSGKIHYVVDSATFKQNKFTPATHIPILSPNALTQDPVDAIIVMAASYSDEVARIIQKKFGKNMNIAILRDFGLEVI
jgi:2-polyprenyl-3-methyl-5-hydroxy-6-metoxy-1,4-benzoquinol methylase